MLKLSRLALFVVLTAHSAPALAADGIVQDQSLSHLGHVDRRPLCPVDGETFDVRLHALAGDLTSVRVQVDDGTVQWIDAAVTESRGPYDVWTAAVPATAASTLSYWFEVSDGGDVDYVSATGHSESIPTDGGFAIDYTGLTHAPLGATPVLNGAVFRVWSPSSSSAFVRGQFNSWGLSHPMTRSGEYFTRRISGALHGQQYKYFFSSSFWSPDARGRVVQNFSGGDNNSVLYNPFLYSWTIEDFETPRLDQMIIYQLHVGTFSGRNDPVGTAPHPARYIDVAARASQLAELGVNAVMLNPIHEFSGALSAGYNPMSHWSPEVSYGTPNEFKFMVDTLHQHGIAVLLDIVWNHFGSSENFLWNYDGTQIYFDSPQQAETPWGGQADFDEPEVQRYFVESAAHWFEEYKIDGFRMDATSYMGAPTDGNGSPDQFAVGRDLLRQLMELVDRRYQDKVLIAEQLPDDLSITTPRSLGGVGFHAQYYDRFTDDLRQEILDAAFGDPEMWKIRDNLIGQGPWLSGSRVVNYFELHDEAWPTSGGGRMVKTIDTTAPHDDQWAKGRTKLAQGLVLTAPGVPAMLQGSEWLEDTDFGTGTAERIDWGKKTTYADVFQYYQDLIALRRDDTALWADASLEILQVDDLSNVIVFRRHNGVGGEMLIVAHFGNGERFGYRIPAPVAGEWTELVNSQDSIYGGNGVTNAGSLQTQAVAWGSQPQSLVLNVSRMSLAVLRPGPPPTSAPVASASSTLLLERPFQNPVQPGATLVYRLSRRMPVEVTVHDIRGRRLSTLANGPQDAGSHELRWNGRGLARGTYFVRIQAGSQQALSKVLVLE